ncbi:MAG: hypothetical protein QXW70_01135 [Candidatus Anstonellales archaeon]
MKRIYEIMIEKKADLKKILEDDPYGLFSFAKNGYKLRDGDVIGEDKNKCYLYLVSEEEKFFEFAKKKLSGIGNEANVEVARRVAEKIENEETSAEIGMGTIFG